MGRNASGLLRSNADIGELTVGQLGLHPKALKAFGGEKSIGGWVKAYNSAIKRTLNDFRSQLSNVTSKSTKEISALKRVVEHFKVNKTQGTKKEFVDYVRRSANNVVLGRYRDSLLLNGGLASDIVESYAVQRAKRMLVPQIIKHLKGL
nr:MAG TPA: hypothetical protein [Caudoviricetes sp.]